jgi:hypothetical protein
LRGVLHREKIESRTPARYTPISLDLRQVDDLTAHYGLPEPAPLQVHCVVPAENPIEIDFLERRIRDLKGDGPDLFVLPHFPMAYKPALHSMAKRNGIAVCATLLGEKTERIHAMLTADGEYIGISSDIYGQNDRFPFPMMHYGPAKVAMAPFDCFAHPELAVAFSKLGCDLVVLSEEKIENDSRLLCAIKTVEKIAVAVCASNGGLVAMVPRDHERWEERSVVGPGVCSYEIDIVRTRKKRFQDRLDFELLLKAN